jgi:hypothetical protein
MIAKDEYYERVDMAVYREVVAPVLSEQILDIHTHVWVQPKPKSRLSQYPEFNGHPYPMERLLHAGALMFPEQTYHAVVFGSPSPGDYEACNECIADECRDREHLYPLYIPDMHASEEDIRQAILDGGFYGFKPYWTMVDWKTEQDDVTIQDMLPDACMRVAEDWGLIIMLHIPGSGRLASQSNIEGIQRLSREYPNAKIIIAHLGRSYCPWSMKGGIPHLCDLPNVYWDTSFVQQSLSYKIFFDHVDPAKVMYGTDLPISEVRGRRVCINGNWVDVSRERLSWTASRDPEHAIEGTFMTYEMIRAMREGAEEAGLSVDDLKPIFFENGMELIQDVESTLQSLS